MMVTQDRQVSLVHPTPLPSPKGLLPEIPILVVDSILVEIHFLCTYECYGADTFCGDKEDVYVP